MSTQNTIVERASAELTKRINGLRKHGNSNSSSINSSTSIVGKTSVMERVTNVLCGGSSSNVHNNNNNTINNNTNSSNAPTTVSINTPEKPYRYQNKNQHNNIFAQHGKMSVTTTTNVTNQNSNSNQSTPQSLRKYHQTKSQSGTKRFVPPATQIFNIEQLFLDERFLQQFFLYFSSYDRRDLAQVCTKWRDILYRNPIYFSGLVPVLQCRELRVTGSQDKVKLYNSIIRRGFHSIALSGATDEDALDIVHSFALASKHIHSLSLRCSSISDRGLEALLDHLQSLFELELAGCNEITEAGLWACLTSRIVSLSLADCINVADEAVGAVAQLLPSLYEFSLQAYHVTDSALSYFSPKQSHSLSILRLNSCWELTNHGVVNIVHSLPHLTVLSLSGCSKITDDGVELIAENLQKLRALDLSWCPRITDAALEYIACDLNMLEELTLDRCIHITDIGVGYISTMISLNALFLRWCSQIRDFGLQHLCSMRNLQVLSLAGCPLLTSSGLSSIIQLRHLQELELTNCAGASQELFSYLREHLPRCLIIE
ncbi:CLUMA_CG001278, isoform A [Clunio marinus]|uniref:CLUMA_CG001278, isoform A n=1 Tax=Clunio marinus TaxID=568069 RepID=A0A1J1HHJ7_9DIPT|nr:CLUMA_CG001278, isoform A [Clunio marinus]